MTPHSKHNRDMKFVMFYFGLRYPYAYMKDKRIKLSALDWKYWADVAQGDNLIEVFIKEWVTDTPFAERDA